MGDGRGGDGEIDGGSLLVREDFLVLPLQRFMKEGDTLLLWQGKVGFLEAEEAFQWRYRTFEHGVTDQVLDRGVVAIGRGARHHRALRHFREARLAPALAQRKRCLDERAPRAPSLIHAAIAGRRRGTACILA